jgi:hydroxyacylglutathione hydrolase
MLRDRAGDLRGNGPVLLYCKSGGRSAIGGSLLRAAGLPDVHNVEGGMDERARLGLPVVR